MKKGVKWKWDEEMQTAFELLRQQFAAGIYLIHPNEDSPFSMFTDASKYAVSAVLTQPDRTGSPQTISTASRVLNATEQRYSTCEQKLLAIVYALQKFRIYVFGRKIRVNTNNQALSFLKKCILTSNRMCRWVCKFKNSTWK
jgi:hypothetical protein